MRIKMQNKIVTVIEKDDKAYGLATKLTGRNIKVQKIPFGMSGLHETSNDTEENDDNDDTEIISSVTRRRREEIEKDFQTYADTGESDSAYVEDYRNTYGDGVIPDLTNYFDKY